MMFSLYLIPQLSLANVVELFGNSSNHGLFEPLIIDLQPESSGEREVSLAEISLTPENECRTYSMYKDSYPDLPREIFPIVNVCPMRFVEDTPSIVSTLKLSNVSETGKGRQVLFASLMQEEPRTLIHNSDVTYLALRHEPDPNSQKDGGEHKAGGDDREVRLVNITKIHDVSQINKRGDLKFSNENKVLNTMYGELRDLVTTAVEDYEVQDKHVEKSAVYLSSLKTGHTAGPRFGKNVTDDVNLVVDFNCDREVVIMEAAEDMIRLGIDMSTIKLNSKAYSKSCRNLRVSRNLFSGPTFSVADPDEQEDIVTPSKEDVNCVIESQMGFCREEIGPFSFFQFSKTSYVCTTHTANVAVNLLQAMESQADPSIFVAQSKTQLRISDHQGNIDEKITRGLLERTRSAINIIRKDGIPAVLLNDKNPFTSESVLFFSLDPKNFIIGTESSLWIPAGSSLSLRDLLEMYESGVLKVNKKNLSLSIAHALNNHHIESTLFTEFVCLLSLNECSPSLRLMLSKINRVYKINSNGYHTFLKVEIDSDEPVPMGGLMNFKIPTDDSCLPNVLSAEYDGRLVPFFKAHVDSEVLESNDTAYDLTTSTLIEIMKGERHKNLDSSLSSVTTDTTGSFLNILVEGFKSLASRGKLILTVILGTPLMLCVLYLSLMMCRARQRGSTERFQSDSSYMKKRRKHRDDFLLREGYTY